MKTDTVAWYRQFWPWFIIFFPVLAIVAGIITLIIAINSPNPVVEDDYYKAGLAINRSIEREKLALTLGLRANLTYPQGAEELVVELLGDVAPPELLSVLFSHPTKVIWDRRATLSRLNGHSYSGPLELPKGGNWDVAIEGGERSWMLKGRVRLPATQVVELIAK